MAVDASSRTGGASTALVSCLLTMISLTIDSLTIDSLTIDSLTIVFAESIFLRIANWNRDRSRTASMGWPNVVRIVIEGIIYDLIKRGAEWVFETPPPPGKRPPVIYDPMSGYNFY